MTIRRALSIVAGIEAVAVAIWLIPASVHIVKWGADGPRRIGLFAPGTSLVWLMIAGLLVAVSLVLRGSRQPAQIRLKADPTTSFAWLCLLWLWVVPFLPWLPDRVPLVLLLAGPLRWVVAGLALALFVRGSWPSLAGSDRSRTASPEQSRRALKADPTTLFGRPAIFIVSLAVYVLFGALHARDLGPGGDEPHYLVITHSLLADRDLLIENNHARGDYRAFFGGPLRPDYMRRGANGEIYSIHAPGLPVLVLPAYALGGYAGVVALLCLIAALTALAIFDLATAIAGPRAGLVAWAAVALTVPFVPHSWLIFPELPAALIVAWAALWVARDVGPTFRSGETVHASAPELKLGPTSANAFGVWVWRGAVLAVLPWLHTKFIIFLVVFGAALLVALRRRPKAAVAMAAPIAVSLAGWLAYFYAIYGSVNPEAPYGAYAAANVVARNIPRGLLGLVIDQKFGLLVYSPIYAFAAAGCWIMLRRREWRWMGAVLLTAVALHAGSTTRLYMWWGGNSAPARFLVPILPCLAPMIAVAVSAIRGSIARTALWATLAVSLVIAFAGILSPRQLLLFSDPRGKGRLVQLIEGSAPLTAVLPTFTQEDWRSPVINVLTLHVPSGEREDIARKGVMDLVWSYDARRLRALDYAELRALNEREVVTAATLVIDRRHSAAKATERTVAGPFTLPPGAYELRISLQEEPAGSGDGEFVVSSGRAIFARRAKVGNPVLLPFELPVAVGHVMLTASTPKLAHTVVRIELVPTALVPPRDREIAGVREIESLPEHPGAYVVYRNEHAYPEGGVFWTRGTGAASVVVAARGVRRLTLRVDSGPLDNEAAITVAGVTRTVRTTASETTDVSFDVPVRMRLIPMTIQASRFFRPSELDSASLDHRGLGCHVQIGLE